MKVSVREFFLKPGDIMCVDVTLINDDMIEGREFFLLALQDLHWGEIVDTAAITINDDDGMRSTDRVGDIQHHHHKVVILG